MEYLIRNHICVTHIQYLRHMWTEQIQFILVMWGQNPRAIVQPVKMHVKLILSHITVKETVAFHPHIDIHTDMNIQNKTYKNSHEPWS